MVQRLSEPIFKKGLIGPRKKVEIVRWVVFKGGEITTTFTYQRLSEQEVVSEFNEAERRAMVRQ